MPPVVEKWRGIVLVFAIAKQLPFWSMADVGLKIMHKQSISTFLSSERTNRP